MNKSPADGLVCRAFCGAVKCGKNPEICRKCLNSVKYGAMIQLSSVRRKAHGLLSFLRNDEKPMGFYRFLETIKRGQRGVSF